MTSDTVFTTKHQGCACFIRYALGDESHRATTIDPERRAVFAFANLDGRAAELCTTFFGSEAVAVGDVRSLLDVSKALRITVSQAIANGGRWENE